MFSNSFIIGFLLTLLQTTAIPSPPSPSMKTTIIALTFLLSSVLFSLVASGRFQFGWSLLLPLILGLAWLIMAFRATMLAWITVLVLLTFAGNRRRVLVRRGGLTGEVTSHFVPLIFKRKRFCALACAALLSCFAALR